MTLTKRKSYRNPKILQSARGQECTVQSPFCINDPETTIAAHSNYMEDGKGRGQKADDIYICFSCGPCHDWLDGRINLNKLTNFPGVVEDENRERRDYFHRAMKKTWRILIDEGILK